jgi:hypothetical protein
MRDSVERTPACCLLAPRASVRIGIVELRAACALLTPGEAILGGNLVFKHRVRTWGVLCKLRFWSECQFAPLLRAFKRRRDVLRRRQHEIAWNGEC